MFHYNQHMLCIYTCVCVYIYIYIYNIRPIFKLRISKFGVWVKQILKRRRWAFLVHRLIS